MSNFAYARTFAALVYRDLTFIISTLGTRLIDGIIITSMQVLVIGYFFPLLGMPLQMIAPWFIGIITQIVFAIAFNIAYKLVNDLHRNRFINYQISLPLPKTWFFASLTLSFMIEIMLITLPLIGFGSLVLKNFLPFHIASWIALLVMYVLSLVTYSLIFLVIAFSSSFTWFLDNVWARRLSPLFLLGCPFFPWKKLLAFNAGVAYLLLLNPITFLNEGLRAALFGTNAYLPVSLCIAVTALICTFLIFLLNRAVKRRLDPV